MQLDDLLKSVPLEYLSSPERRKHIYAFSCGEFLKIGHSSDLKKRLQVLTTSNPYPVTLEMYLTVNAAVVRETEKFIHDALYLYRHQGEWFRTEANKEVRKAFREAGYAAEAIARHYEMMVREYRAAEGLKGLGVNVSIGDDPGTAKMMSGIDA